jgi:alpha-glucosidase
MFHRTRGADIGRDGCRVPLPWSGTRPPFGFGPAGARAEPWLPQPAAWAAYTVEAQDGRPESMLSLYRTALRARRAEPGLRGDAFRWLPGEDGVLAFARAGGFQCLANLSADPVPLPPGFSPVLVSEPLPPGALPPDTIAWLRPAD